MEDKNLVYAIKTLGAVIEERDNALLVKQYRIDYLEEELAKAEKRMKSHRNNDDLYEAKLKSAEDYIDNLQAKVSELEERIAIMTEVSAPKPTWEITPPVDVTEVTNVTKVIEGEAK